VSAKGVVIDASVALKWRLRDEEATHQADTLLDDYLAGALELLTPTLFDYEIANALKVAVDRGRMTETEAMVAMADFQQLGIESTRVHSPRLAASSSYRRKPVSRKPDWIPCQARNDGPEQKTIPRGLPRGSSSA